MTLDGFADRGDVYADIEVCGEVYIPIHHYLLGHHRHIRGKDGNGNITESFRDKEKGNCNEVEVEEKKKKTGEIIDDLSWIRRIYSHPQVWGQCGSFLSRPDLRHAEQIDASSTSRAAQLVGDREGYDSSSNDSAAISSLVARDLVAPGLDVLAARIEDRGDNTTRFFVLRRRNQDQSEQQLPDFPEGLVTPIRRCDPHSDEDKKNENQDQNYWDRDAVGAQKLPPALTKSFVRFSVPHTRPGALAEVLECFRRYDLNLTSISSRPRLGGHGNDSRALPFTYLFFVEFEGHKHSNMDGRMEKVRKALLKVDETLRGREEYQRKQGGEAKWLGSWVIKGW